MCSYPYPINEIEMDELEEQLIEQDQNGLSPFAWRLSLQINSFDEDELNEYNLYTDENDEYETMLCIDDSIELIGYCLIEPF